MERDCCGTVEVFSLFSVTFVGHLGSRFSAEGTLAKQIRPWTHHRNLLSPSGVEDPPPTHTHPPWRAPGTNGFVKGVTELHCGSCRSLTLLKQRRSKSLSGPFFFEMLHCIKSDLRLPLPASLHLFVFFLSFHFCFPIPWTRRHGNTRAFPTDDEVEDDDDCHGNARRRLWEERDGDGKRAAVHSVEFVSETDAGGHWLFHGDPQNSGALPSHSNAIHKVERKCR